MRALSFFTRAFAPSECLVNTNFRRCLRNRLHGNRCDLCLQICPTGAISCADGSFHLAEKSCNNCMGCTAVCPNDALVPCLDLEKIVNQTMSSEQMTLCISCERQRLYREDEILVPCLGLFSHELLVYFASVLSKKSIRFNVCGCTNCYNEEISHWFQRNLQDVLRHSDDRHSPKLELITADSHEEIDDDRRSFLKVLQRGAFDAAVSSRTKKEQCQQQPATSRTISWKNVFLKKTLESGVPPHPLATKMVPWIHIGDSCTPCPRCAGICPTGALKMVRLDQGKKMEFDGSFCSGCALCVNFCKEDALTLGCMLQI